MLYTEQQMKDCFDAGRTLGYSNFHWPKGKPEPPDKDAYLKAIEEDVQVTEKITTAILTFIEERVTDGTISKITADKLETRFASI